MKRACSKIVFLLFVSVLVLSCSIGEPLEEAISVEEPLSPPLQKEILIDSGSIDKLHTVLGQISYTLRKNTTAFSNKIDDRNQAINFLKREARAKYGDNVDAIIDTKIQESTQDDPDGLVNVIYVEGTAVAIDSVQKPKSSARVKKHRKKVKHLSSWKSKRHFARKSRVSRSDEADITPTEILK